MTDITKAEVAEERAEQARMNTLTDNCKDFITDINLAVEAAVNNGENRCKVSITHISTGQRRSLIMLLKCAGYEAADVSSIKPQEPFEIDIRWQSPA